MKKIFFLSLFISFGLNSSAQKLSADQQKKVNALFEKRKVVYFTFPVNSMQEIAPLAKMITIDGNKGATVNAHATKDQFSKFIVKNYAYKVVPAKKAPVKKKAAVKKK